MAADPMERVLFVHAHPGNESLSAGGTIAQLTASGSTVIVLTCTPEGAGELAEALAILGVSDHRYLGEEGARWPGNAVRRYSRTETGVGARTADSGSGSPIKISADSLTAASFGEVAADIAAAIAEVAPHVVVSYNEWGGDGHPDRIRAHQAARRAAEVMGVAFYVIEPEGSASTPTLSVDVTTQLALKRRAVAAQPANLAVSGNTATLLRDGGGASLGATEHFRRVYPVPEPSGAFSELGLLAKFSAAVLAGVLGGVGGLLLTAIHQWTVSLWGTQFPAGVVVAMLASTALIVGLRLAGDTRVLPAVAGALLLTATAILAFPTPGGSVIVPANLAGYVWSFGPTLVTLLVLAWPKVRRPVAGKIRGVPAVKGSSIP
jgi:N-acetyl-1-D-myo-inositol-2-amino-2-deoxy-alpha-D-glucopyranoside deacetylase